MLRIIMSDVAVCESSACCVKFIGEVVDSRLVGGLIVGGVVGLEYFGPNDWYMDEGVEWEYFDRTDLDEFVELVEDFHLVFVGVQVS